jgi:hypothetical protein
MLVYLKSKSRRDRVRTARKEHLWKPWTLDSQITAAAGARTGRRALDSHPLAI